ncbi:hypothetical protein TNCV_4814191 [Trichonephila clavipes]|nr:hypothetical protein TNCV_4814191 [Trichonephila clavipes]
MISCNGSIKGLKPNFSALGVKTGHSKIFFGGERLDFQAVFTLYTGGTECRVQTWKGGREHRIRQNFSALGVKTGHSKIYFGGERLDFQAVFTLYTGVIECRVKTWKGGREHRIRPNFSALGVKTGHSKIYLGGERLDFQAVFTLYTGVIECRVKTWKGGREHRLRLNFSALGVKTGHSKIYFGDERLDFQAVFTLYTVVIECRVKTWKGGREHRLRPNFSALGVKTGHSKIYFGDERLDFQAVFTLYTGVIECRVKTWKGGREHRLRLNFSALGVKTGHSKIYFGGERLDFQAVFTLYTVVIECRVKTWKGGREHRLKPNFSALGVKTGHSKIYFGGERLDFQAVFTLYTVVIECRVKTWKGGREHRTEP